MVLTIPRCHEHAASTNVFATLFAENEAEKAEACRSLDTFCRSDARVAVAFRRCRFAIHRLPLRSLFFFLILLLTSIVLSVLGQDSSVPNRTIARSLNSSNFISFFSREGDGIVSEYFQALHFVRIYSSILIRAFIHVICTSSAYVLLYIVCFTTNIL